MECSAAFLAAAVARWTPEFRLHPRDGFMPCSAEFFMQHSELRMRQPGGAVTELAPRGALDGAALLRCQAAAPPGAALWMHLDPAARRGAPRDSLPDVPVYAHAKAVLARDGSGVEALEINYVTLFAFNGPYDVGGLGLVHAGAHDGDIEHITARVHPSSGALLGMWYNSHRSRDGEWVPGPMVPRTRAGRPVAYVALHGHGNYPNPGTVLRHFCLGNDRCSAEGPVWLPRRVVVLPPLRAPKLRAGAADGAEVEPSAPAVAAAAGWAGTGGGVRALVHCRSRGCSLGHLEREEGALGADVDGGAAEADPAAVEAVLDEPCEWAHFRGHWGATPSPIAQRWLHTAETPVSRTPLQRLFLHLWPETEAL
jgi:hypothetical protein